MGMSLSNVGGNLGLLGERHNWVVFRLVSKHKLRGEDWESFVRGIQLK